MQKHHVTITPEVREVLTRSTISADSVTLPSSPRLERSLYASVNKVLELAGGKWSKKAQAHVFPNDPREALGLALEKGAIKDQKKATQAFYTPTALAKRLVEISGIEAGDLVLEPSAGQGAIANQIEAIGAEVNCFEIDPVSVRVLKSAGYAVKECDFLATMPQGPLYDAVLMNPPFTAGQDIAHVTHAHAHFLKSGGQLVAIMSPGWQSAQTKKAAAFRELVALNGEIVEEVEAGAFKESGTNIATVIIRISKP